MRCPRCHQENAAARWCSNCGASLALACPACGAANDAAHRFCAACGAALGPPAPSAGSTSWRRVMTDFVASAPALEAERKQITVLFADVKSSMELLSALDPEDARRLLDPVLERMMDAVHRYGGTVNQVMGDGIMALFGAPIADEDHAMKACCAALRIQESVASWNHEMRSAVGTPVQVRIGLNSGEVVVRSIGNDLHLDYSAVGPATFLAARMEQIAAPGTVLLTADVLRLAGSYLHCKPLGRLPIKGLRDAREVFELQAITPGTRFAVRAVHGLTRFVGRTRDLARLAGALAAARGGQGQLVGLVGDPGVGKSRIVWELIHGETAHGCPVLTASAASYASETSHFLVIELLKVYFGIKESQESRTIRGMVTERVQALDPALAEVVDPVLALLDVLPEDRAFHRLHPSERRQRTLEATRRLLLAETRDHPLILVLEDLHWIDAASRAFLDRVIDGLPSTRLLVLATFRSEYEPGWRDTAHSTILHVHPLSAEGARELLDALLGAAPELQALKRLLAERCGGNPFFLEEIVRTLFEQEVLGGGPGAFRLTRPVASVRVPPSVQAVLAARIDRLDRADKELLQWAAVIGREVPALLLDALADRPEDDVRRALARLCRSEFLHEVGVPPESYYAFQHPLTHEVAYGSILRERRRVLHARIVEAIERRYADRLSDHAERLAHHAQEGEVWERAVEYLRLAAAQAYRRGALDDAIDRYEAALTIVARLPATPETARRSIDLRLDLHAPLMTVGRTQRILELYPEAERLARALDDPLPLGHVLQRMSQLAWLAGQYRAGTGYADHALRIAEGADDAVLRLHAHYFLGLNRHALGEYHQAIPCFAYLVEGPGASLASRVISVTIPLDVPGWGWLGLARAMTGDLAGADVALQRAVAAAEGSEFPQARVIARTIEAVVRAHAGRAESCLATLRSAVELCEQIGFFVWLAAAYSTLGLVLTRSGSPEPALPYLERGVTINEKTGVRTYQAQRYGWWAEGLFRAGRLDEAAAHAETAAGIAAAMEEPGVEAEALLVRALVAHATGRHAEAREWFERVLAMSAAFGVPLLQAHGHLGLASLASATGDPATARASHAAAAAIFQRTGAAPWWLAD